MTTLYYKGQPVSAKRLQIVKISEDRGGYALNFGYPNASYYLDKKKGRRAPKIGEYVSLYYSSWGCVVACYFRGKCWYRSKELQEV